jgi:hypothetical protein
VDSVNPRQWYFCYRHSVVSSREIDFDLIRAPRFLNFFLNFAPWSYF